jgi:hypothetical protein
VDDLDLLRLLGETTTLLRTAGLDPQLVGALAIRLHVDARAFSGEQTPVNPDVPETLARVVEATGDIDLVVRDFPIAERLLIAAGFKKDERALVTFKKGAENVDLIPGSPSIGPGGPIDIPIDACASVPFVLPGGSGTIQIAAPGALVVLKARAWRDRHDPRDLADIGALGLAHWFLDLSMEEGMRHALVRLPDAKPALRQVQERFRTANDIGPGAFYKVVLQRVAPTDSEAWEERYEATVRELVADAVGRLVRDFA